jgi:hypothetical protein
MKTFLRRREFLVGSIFGLFAVSSKKLFAAPPAPKAPGAAITEKDILKEGKPAAVANYCEDASKKPNKFCPQAAPGTSCSICQFYTLPTETTFKGKKYAKCQIVPTPPSYVASTGVCATFVKRAGA